METTDKYASMIAGLESQGLSRSEIARGAKVSRQTIWRLAVGDARMPSYETVERLMQFERRVAGVDIIAR